LITKNGIKIMPTLEEIERNLRAIQAKIPAIETGIKQLSSSSTPADLGVLSLYSPNVEYETARKEYEKTFPTEIPDSEKIRSDTMAQFQAEIDALTKIQAEKSAEIQEKYKTIGKERAGKTRALLARAGMLGQVSGFGQQQEIEEATEAEKQAALEKVGAEYGGLIAGLRGEARRLAQDEYNRRYEAARQGAEAKLEEIRTRPERTQVAISDIAKKALALGIDLEKDTNTLNATLKDLSSGGLTATANDILSVYKSEKSAMEAEQEKLRQETEKEELGMEKTKAEIEKLKREPTGTQTERDRALATAMIAKARPVLESSKKGGENIDGNEFLRLRQDYIEIMGNASAFDSAFVPWLSESDRNKYFKTYKPEEEDLFNKF